MDRSPRLPESMTNSEQRLKQASVLYPIQNANVAFGAVAELRERLLVCTAAVCRDCGIGAIEADDGCTQSSGSLQHMHRVAAGEEHPACRPHRRTGQLDVARKPGLIMDGGERVDPIGGHAPIIPL